jgi:hypothetical protein
MAAELSKSHDETIDPDRLVSAQSPLHTQLVGCVAEHAAIEDTLFYLSKALAKKLIPLQDYLTVCVCGPMVTVKCRNLESIHNNANTPKLTFAVRVS